LTRKDTDFMVNEMKNFFQKNFLDHITDTRLWTFGHIALSTGKVAVSAGKVVTSSGETLGGLGKRLEKNFKR
jgi:hypothetical protein